MSAAATVLTPIVNEKSTAVYAANLTDENDVAIGSGVIDVLTMTLSNVVDGAIINARDGQDVLNTNNVTVSAGGALVFTMQPADTAIIDSTRDVEVHRATFQLQFNSVSYSTWDVEFTVRNLKKVT